jgi:hypothetical protein
VVANVESKPSGHTACVEGEIMKTIVAVGVLLLLSVLSCTAGVMTSVNETFASGAVFNGTVTFLDDYSNVSAVDGWLTGGGYGNDYIDWIWEPTSNYASSFGSQYGGNFLMDGSQSGGYQYWVTFTWDFSNAPNLVLASPGGVLATDGGNNINYTDPLVSGSISSAPEPATSALIAGGLLAVAAFLRRRQKQR